VGELCVTLRRFSNKSRNEFCQTSACKSQIA
jgi:hypothetical protein